MRRSGVMRRKGDVWESDQILTGGDFQPVTSSQSRAQNNTVNCNYTETINRRSA